MTNLLGLKTDFAYWNPDLPADATPASAPWAGEPDEPTPGDPQG
jgi:hypothetical protein